MADADARTYAQRNQRGSDWFNHDSSKPTPAAAAAASASPSHKTVSEPVLPAAAAATATNNGASDTNVAARTQMIKPKCDSNQWFKHDAGAAAEPAAQTPAVISEPVVAAPTVSAPEVKGRDTRDGDAYCRRDKMGSSAAWFSHDHADNGAASGASTARVTSKEGGDNASRMRGESENWFNHDANKTTTAPQDVHVAKGRNNRAQNSDMHHIFHQGK